MDYDNILTSSENGIALITINRPAKLNALNKATIQELHNALELFDSTPEIRAIIIIGSGDKAFVAGADISEFANFSISKAPLSRPKDKNFSSTLSKILGRQSSPP